MSLESHPSKVVKTRDSGIRLPGFTSWLFYLLSLGPHEFGMLLNLSVP